MHCGRFDRLPHAFRQIIGTLPVKNIVEKIYEGVNAVGNNDDLTVLIVQGSDLIVPNYAVRSCFHGIHCSPISQIKNRCLHAYPLISQSQN